MLSVHSRLKCYSFSVSLTTWPKETEALRARMSVLLNNTTHWPRLSRARNEKALLKPSALTTANYNSWFTLICSQVFSPRLRSCPTECAGYWAERRLSQHSSRTAVWQRTQCELANIDLQFRREALGGRFKVSSTVRWRNLKTQIYFYG